MTKMTNFYLHRLIFRLISRLFSRQILEKVSHTFLKFSALAIFSACSASQKMPQNIDLTQLSSAIVYAQVYNMLMEAEKFNGVHVKMNGIFYENSDSDKGSIFQCVLVKDNTGCCSVGFDILKGSESIKFPANLTEIQVEGTFIVKEDSEGITRSYLVAEKLDWQ